MDISAKNIRNDAKKIAQDLLETAVERGDMREAIRLDREKYATYLKFEDTHYFVVCLQYLAGKNHMRLDFRDDNFIDVTLNAEMIDFLTES